MTSLSSVLFILTGASGLLPKIELWVDMRTTLRAPGEALEELYHGVVKELKSTGGTPPSGSISGVVVWHDPKSEWPEGLGDLPVVAVDPGGNDVSTLVSVPIVWTRRRSETQARAPSSTATMGDPLVLEPPFSSEAVANIEAGSCVIVDGARPDVWDESTLPLVKVLAAASVDRARLLVSLFDPPQLNSCCEALVLGSLAGSAVVNLGLGEEEKTSTNEEFSAGCGIAIPPDPRLWSHAVMYKS